MEDRQKRIDVPHNVIIENRSKVNISGVKDVDSFNENEIVVITAKGTLVISGSGLHIERLSVESGDVKVEGVVNLLEYEDAAEKKDGFFSRLFN